VKAAIASLDQDTRCLHVTAHYSAADRGAIRFDGQTLVSVYDICNLRAPNLELVVLSCCESAGGLQTHTETAVSLVDAFGLAGVDTVLATQWRVSDSASAELAQRFYAGLAAGRSKADALRSAQLALKGTPGFEHPFYWSAFALFGDPR
jgi:CHAT domain-containing protein